MTNRSSEDDRIMRAWFTMQTNPSTGKVRSLKRANGSLTWVIDLGKKKNRLGEQSKPRFLYSFRGKGFKTKAEADYALRVMEHERHLNDRSLADTVGLLGPRYQPKAMLKNQLECWIKTKRQAAKAGDITNRYVQDLERNNQNYFIWWHDKVILDITAANVNAFARWLGEQKLSPKSRFNLLGIFKGFVNWLVDDEEALAKVPKWPTVKVPEFVPVILSAEQQAKVLLAIREERRGIFLALCHGIRPSEARALIWSDYSIDTQGNGWIYIQRAYKGQSFKDPIGPTKNKKARRIPVNNELMDWLAKHPSRGSEFDKTVPMFPNYNVDHRRWTNRTLQEAWSKACQKVGVRAPLYSGTKHSFATNAYAEGAPLDDLRKYLGHANVHTTQRYAKIADKSLLRVINRRKQ